MLHKRYFPSYNKIHQSILKELEEEQLKKKHALEQKIYKMQNSLNLEEEHCRIKQTLLKRQNSPNYEYMKSLVSLTDQSKQRLQKQPKQSLIFTSGNQESLNYCIDQDTEEENHYENHLKFKRQVLERDLFEGKNNNVKNKHHDEQYIFKSLYDGPKDDFLCVAKAKDPLKRAASSKPRNFYSSEAKRALQINLNKGSNGKTRRQYGRKQNDMLIVSHGQMWKKNRKMLVDNYSRYLKDLEHTNIIKWRITNQATCVPNKTKGFTRTKSIV